MKRLYNRSDGIVGGACVVWNLREFRVGTWDSVVVLLKA